MPNCPHCSQTWNEIIGPGGSHTVTPLVKQRLRNIRGFDSYTCPKCGYTEFYKTVEL